VGWSSWQGKDGCSPVADLLLGEDGGRRRTLHQDLSSVPARQDFTVA